MQALNFTLELFRKHGVPFKLSSEEEGATKERILKVSRIAVSRAHVEKGHVQSYLNILTSAEKKKKNGRNSLIFLFEGYENDPRRMYDVPEIKAWVQRMFKNKPHLFYFLVNLNPDYFHDMVLCLVQPEPFSVPKELQKYMRSSTLVLNGADVTPAIRKAAEKMFLYALKLKHSPEELMEICMTFLDNTKYEQHVMNFNQWSVQ